MSRTIVIGLTVLILAACGPADQTPTAESAAPASVPAPSPSPAAATNSPRPSEPMSWEAMQDRYQPMGVEPTDPLEALEYRAVICSHLSGEVGSEVPEQEQYLNAQIEKLRCEDTLVADVRAMRQARSNDPVAVSRLDTILANLY